MYYLEFELSPNSVPKTLCVSAELLDYVGDFNVYYSSNGSESIGIDGTPGVNRYRLLNFLKFSLYINLFV